MGCSSSREQVITRAETASDDESEDISWPEVLCGEQASRLPSKSTTTSASTAKGTSRSASKASIRSQASQFQSHSKSFVHSSEAYDDDSMGIDWPELLCGTHESSLSAATTASTCAQASGSESRCPLGKSRVSIFSAHSRASCSSVEGEHARWFDLLEVEQLRHIQVEIFRGMLIALADTGNAALGVGALPCNPAVALSNCQRDIKRGEASFVLALAELVLSFKVALVDAGVDRIKMHQVFAVLGRLLPGQIHASLSGEIFVNGTEVIEIVKYAKANFLLQRWDEFGYAAGRMALDLGNVKTNIAPNH